VMRYIKKCGLFTILLLFMLCFLTISASAEENFNAELYQRQYESSGAAELSAALPNSTTKILDNMGIDISNPTELFNPKTENILSALRDFLTEGIKEPLQTALAVIGVLLIFASFDGIAVKATSGNMMIFVCFVSSLIATKPVFAVMEVVKTAIQTLSGFMFSFVPVYTSVMLSSGNTAAAGGFSTLLLGASEVISYLISYFFVPVSGAVMCLGICGGVSPVVGISRLSEWIKKTANWAMGIATTLFLGILSLQNTFATAADGIGIRTSKVMLSTAIPIMGPAIAESINTARGCLGLLRSGVGIYAVLAIVIIALPVIIQLVLWRISMWVTSGVAEMLGMKQVEGLLRSVDFCISVLLAAVCFTTLLFIISLTVCTGVGN